MLNEDIVPSDLTHQEYDSRRNMLLGPLVLEYRSSQTSVKKRKTDKPGLL